MSLAPKEIGDDGTKGSDASVVRFLFRFHASYPKQPQISYARRSKPQATSPKPALSTSVPLLATATYDYTGSSADNGASGQRERERGRSVLHHETAHERAGENEREDEEAWTAVHVREVGLESLAHTRRMEGT